MQSNLIELITIDRRSAVHYDQQIKESIKSLILDQTFYYQTRLPVPTDLAEWLNIERKWALSAYNQLSNERYIKKEGDGTYSVSFIELTNYFFDRNVAIYDAIIALGLDPSIQCVEKRVVRLDKAVIEQMGFDSQKSNAYFYINRLYMGDKKPIIILENYLPLYVFPDIDKKFQGDEPLNAYIGEHYGIQPSISKRITKAVNLTPKLAKYLNERKNGSSIQSTNRVYDLSGRLIDFGQSHTISSYYFQNLIDRQEMADYASVTIPDIAQED